jgi:antitoxin component YwqK of YwqJK toxin-antitoxin module
MLLLGMCPFFLVACGNEAIDSRQVDVNQGLAYKHGSDDPFTGTIAFKGAFGDMPDAVKGYVNTQMNTKPTAVYALNTVAGFECDVGYVKGLMDGSTKCTNSSGDTFLTVSIANEKLDGASTIRNPTTGVLYAELKWKAGDYDGKQVYYSDDGKTAIDEFTILNDAKDGREVMKDATGKTILDGVWAQGKPLSGILSVGNDTFTYANGKKNGPASLYANSADDSRSEGSLKDNIRVGDWVDAGQLISPIFGSVLNQDTVSLGQASDAIHNDFENTTKLTSTWENGQLVGKLQGFDKTGKLLVSMGVKDSKPDGAVNYYIRTVRSPEGYMVHAVMSNGVLSQEGVPSGQSAGDQQHPAPGAGGMPAAIAKAMSQLPAGSPLVIVGVTGMGYPEFSVACDKTRCASELGSHQEGTTQEVAMEMLPVDPSDVGDQSGITCDGVLCREIHDGVISIIGRDPTFK